MFDRPTAHLERRQQPLARRRRHHVARRPQLPHRAHERRVDALEQRCLGRQLLPDVLGGPEDVFEVHPGPLDLQDRLDRLAHGCERRLPTRHVLRSRVYFEATQH
jgi:hypothetical protein